MSRILYIENESDNLLPLTLSLSLGLSLFLSPFNMSRLTCRFCILLVILYRKKFWIPFPPSFLPSHFDSRSIVIKIVLTLPFSLARFRCYLEREKTWKKLLLLTFILKREREQNIICNLYFIFWKKSNDS